MDHFSLSLLGYNRQEVNSKIDNYHERINQLEKELEQLKKEHETVMTEVENYRHMENALQEGILDARVTGNKIIDESSAKANKILEQTNEQILQYKEEFAYHSRELVGSGSGLKEEMKAMKDAFQEILDTYQEKLDQTDFDALYPKKHIERLLMQVEAYDSEEDINLDFEANSTLKTPSISDSEKAELEKLIQEVISNDNETTKEDHPSSNLVDFSMIKNSKEG